MMRLIKWVLLVALLALHLGAQTTGQNVRGLQWVTASAITSQTTFTSIDLPNIGQTSHSLRISLTGLAHNWNGTAVIQGSMDGTNWFAIGPGVYPQSAFFLTQSSISVFGSGSYPHLRCTATITPTGGDTITVNAYYYANSAPALATVDMTGLVSPVSSIFQGFAASLTNAVMITNPNAATSFTLYGLFIYMPAGLASVNIFCSSGAVSLFYIPTIPAAGMTVTQPSSLRPYAVCPAGDNVTITTGAGGLTILNMTYRFE